MHSENLRHGERVSFSVEKAREMQINASKKVIREDTLPSKISYVAGVDVAYEEDMSYGAATVIDYEKLALVESRTAIVKTRFPYMPTLLSFRELPAALAAIQQLHTQPDVFLVDGNGILHPRRLGLASHLGLVIRRPTIGVAKGLLTGTVGFVNVKNWALIKDSGEVIGAAFSRRVGWKPIYVSVGHMVSLARAMEVIEHCTQNNRIPTPIASAHRAASLEKHKAQNEE